LLYVGMVAASGAADAQQGGKIPRVGIISATTPVSMWRDSQFYQAFLEGLHDLGYQEGRNIAIEFRSAEGNWKRLPDTAAELVDLNVDVLVPVVCGATLNAARKATSTIPIVVGICNDDMVESGIIVSLAHRGGNITGIPKLTPELSAKRLELLKEIVPESQTPADASCIVIPLCSTCETPNS